MRGPSRGDLTARTWPPPPHPPTHTQVIPRSPGFERRAELYQLHRLLNPGFYYPPPSPPLSTFCQVIPRAPGFERRAELYQLYHILNHYNLFGGGYLDQAVSLMTRLANSTSR